MNSEIRHITPLEEMLCSVQTNVSCDKESCNKTFKSIPALKFHQSQFHEHRRLKKVAKMDSCIEQCYHCPVENCIYYYSPLTNTSSRHFAKLQYLKQHYLKVHSLCTYTCELCSKQYSTKALLNAHQQYCDLELTCSCNQTFSSITALQTHARRKGHDAEVLMVYNSRIMNKKNMKKIKDIKTAQSFNTKIGGNASAPGSSPPSALVSIGPQKGGPILPKSQPSHLVAAIALVELAFTGLRRRSTVEMGTQTDPQWARRVSRKSFSPVQCRESSFARQRKQTTEMETQTRLTNLKNKGRRRNTSRRVSKCHIATDMGIPQIAGVPHVTDTGISQTVSVTQGVETSHNWGTLQAVETSLAIEISKAAHVPQNVGTSQSCGVPQSVRTLQTGHHQRISSQQFLRTSQEEFTSYASQSGIPQGGTPLKIPEEHGELRTSDEMTPQPTQVQNLLELDHYYVDEPGACSSPSFEGFYCKEDVAAHPTSFTTPEECQTFKGVRFEGSPAGEFSYNSNTSGIIQTSPRVNVVLPPKEQVLYNSSISGRTDPSPTSPGVSLDVLSPAGELSYNSAIIEESCTSAEMPTSLDNSEVLPPTGTSGELPYNPSTSGVSCGRSISIQVDEPLLGLDHIQQGSGFDESPIPILTDEEDNLVTMSPSGRISPLEHSNPPRRAPTLSSQNRSSSIETQTDCDVFLTSTDYPVKEDIILTSTQTQTESVPESSSLWCESETQTWEDFSDIEPFLCSTIHTQTVAGESSEELFPELSLTSIATKGSEGKDCGDGDYEDSEGCEDPAPLLVTTRTQTSIWGLGSYKDLV